MTCRVVLAKVGFRLDDYSTGSTVGGAALERGAEQLARDNFGFPVVKGAREYSTGGRGRARPPRPATRRPNPPAPWWTRLSYVRRERLAFAARVIPTHCPTTQLERSCDDLSSWRQRRVCARHVVERLLLMAVRGPLPL